ncbi:unnamed protein product, partial [Pylaiella littoralis]
SNNRVQLFDASSRKLLKVVGRRGQIRPGRMQGPEGVAFVDGRREMIVADTGNNRLQVFHIEELTMPPDDPCARPPRTRRSSGSASNDSRCRDLSSSSSEHSTAAGAGLDEDRGDESSRACLLVFAGGGEHFVGAINRRAAGESETAEGPLSQPCDVAYWRARRRPQRRELTEEDDTAVWAWTAALPPWFRPHVGSGGGRTSSSSSSTTTPSSFSATDDENVVRRELLSPSFPPWNSSISVPSREGNKKRSGGLRSNESTRQAAAPGIYGGVVGSGEPPVGAFVVRETGYRGKLQLLYVAKTKETEEAEQAAAHENEDAENASVSALSGDGSEEEGSSRGGSDWMKQAAR